MVLGVYRLPLEYVLPAELELVPEPELLGRGAVAVLAPPPDEYDRLELVDGDREPLEYERPLDDDRPPPPPRPPAA